MKAYKILDPLHIEYLPTIQKKTISVPETKNTPLIDTYEESEVSSLLKDVGSLALKGGIAYLTGGISLLRYTRTFANLLIDMKNGDLDAIWKKTFKNSVYGPKIKHVQKLISEGVDDEALTLLDNLLVDLETIDDSDIRSGLNVLRAKLHFKNGRFLAAAIYYMEAATLTSSQKIQQMGKESNESLINKCGMLYLLSLQSLSAHLKNHSFDDNFQFLINDLGNRAKTLFEREARYRTMDLQWKKSGEVSIGKVKIPYGLPGFNQNSPDLNNKLALEVEKIKSQIEKRAFIKDIEAYLNSAAYKNDDIEYLLEAAEEVLASEVLDSLPATVFFEFLEQKMIASKEYSSCLSHLDILKIQLRMKQSKGTEDDILRIFKLLDTEKNNESSFYHLLAIADKLSTQLSHELRKDFASIVLEKNYPFISDNQKLCYAKIAQGSTSIQDDELNCIYPSNVLEFKRSIENLEIRERAVIHKGQVEVLSHDQFKELTAKKAKSLFPKEDFLDYEFLINKKKEAKAVYDSDDLLGLTSNLINELHLENKLPGVRERVKNQRARIGVFGLTKVGKSTFLNTLIGKEVLKSDRNVATNIVTFIRKSPQNKAIVHYENKSTLEISINDVVLFTSEQHNPQNKKQVSKVEVLLNCSLPTGVELLDIPGFGVNDKNFELHKGVIDHCLAMVDGMFLVTTPNDCLKNFELEFIKEATVEKKVPFVLVANKMDELDEDEANDLKAGLKEKLIRNGIDQSLFPVYFVSSQLGLSFVENTDKSRYFNMKLEEAQLESGLLPVKDSLRLIGDKILSLKDASIVEVLKHETEKYKRSLVEMINDTELVRKGSADDIQKSLLALRASDMELTSVVNSDIEKYKTNLQYLENLNIDDMSSRLIGRASFDKFSDKKLDVAIAEKHCADIFKEETSFLKFMNEQLERFQERLEEFALKNNLELDVEPEQVEEYKKQEVKDAYVEHLVSKILAPDRTLKAECFKILNHLKANEYRNRTANFNKLLNQKQHIHDGILEKINNIEKAMSFSEKEFLEKKAYCLSQIEICNKYLNMLSDNGSNHAS